MPREPLGRWSWPQTEHELLALQLRLADAAASAVASDPWETPGVECLFGGCFVAYQRGTVGPGRAGDEAWAAAVVWRNDPRASVRLRRSDRHLRGSGAHGPPRRADDVLSQHVVATRVPAPYEPGILALREGRVLEAALAGLDPCPAVVLVDATGLDHPRGAGLALHLGAVVGMPTVGVTRHPLVARGSKPPALKRGSASALRVGGRVVAYWVCTRSDAQPLVAHAAWRTSPETALRIVLDASTPAARTPVPLQEARRVAREARSLDRSQRPHGEGFDARGG